MSGVRVRQLLALVVAFVAVVVTVTLVGRTLVSAGSYLLRFPTPDASGLYPGSDVMIGGARVGGVEDVGLTSGGLALVTVSVDPAYAPVHRDATVAIRPKSLLGEMYVALDPGRAAGVLPSGATLPGLQVNRSTDLQEVINTFDQPTRERLQTLIVELGAGLAGRGQGLNLTLAYGRDDLEQLAAIANTLAQRSQDLETVIQDLNVVLGELARSDRRQELSVLIQNTEQLLANLSQQQAQLERAIVETNAALARLSQGLDGTGPSLSGIFGALPVTVEQGQLLLSTLTTDSNVLLPNLNTLIEGIDRGPVVFGGRDATGYATRISLVVGCSSAAVCPQLTGPLAQLPVSRSVPVVGTAVPPPAGAASGGQSDQALLQRGILGFLLGGTLP
ncbi:MAG TPA: MlaD family protein [Candidatus Dormibacteraeota bacterium]|jgi:virulence factor Mce-like protein|nr:MlaD family protein [Candidatus Dormibacteraeota bacterium]